MVQATGRDRYVEASRAPLGRTSADGSTRLALGGSKPALRLPGLGDADRVRRFAGHSPREPANERESGGARRLRHLRLADQPRDVADEAGALALVGDVVWAERTDSRARRDA